MAAIGLLEIDFLIPASQSLKGKRNVVKSLKDKLRQRYNVSVSEVGMQELVGRCHLAVLTVSSSRIDAEKRLNSAGELIDTNSEIQVLERTLTWL